MSSNSHQKSTSLDAFWTTQVPLGLAGIGGLVGLIGLFMNPGQFAHSYLLAFMFFLSIALGALFLVIIHHLFDANWSVPIRRFLEHQACLLSFMAILFIPIAIMAKPLIYAWMSADPEHDHALHVKHALFNMPMFYIVAVLLFGVWTWLTRSLRNASLEQDRTGSPECTHRMRKLAAGGIYIFAFSLTFAAIFWMKSLEHQWFSTMYGVYYFAASVWTTLATTYLITVYFTRTGLLKDVVTTRTFHSIGVLLFAFTVFYAYIHFSQYFLIWNAAIPEETFWYVERESGSWWDIGMLLIFGHFAIPFLLLLRIDAKLNFSLMVPLCIWAWAMHYCDMSFNIMPLIHPDNFVPHILDFSCMLFIGGLLAWKFFKDVQSHPAYPQKDPRIAESMGVYVEPLSSQHASSEVGK